MRLKYTSKKEFGLNLFIYNIYSHMNATDLFCVICCDEEWGLMAVSTFEEIIPVISAGN